MNTLDTIEVVTTVTYIFFVYLLLAVFVERTIEVLLSVFDYCELKFPSLRKFWNTRADHYEERFNRLYVYAGARDETKRRIFDWILWKVIVDRPNTGGKDIISADLIRINYLKIASRMAAFAISLVLVLTQWKTVDVILILEKSLESTPNLPQALHTLLNNLANLTWFRVILTTALLTVGSEPLHELIKKAEARISDKSREPAGGEQ